jgi:hypothetical protein
MASINDVFNQLVAVNGKLDQLHTDSVAGTNATNQVRTAVDTLDNDVKAGFAATVAALNTLAAIETAAVKLLFHLTQQADAIICNLEHISKNTCGILTQVTIQTGLQRAIRDDIDVIRDMEEAENPAAALNRSRLLDLQAKIERCCPPPPEPPACTYEPCPKPRPIERPDLPRTDNRPIG